MSPRDIRAELSSAHVEAPAELRTRVRLIAAQAPPPRRLTRRRLTLVLVPVAAAAAIAAAVILSTRSSGPAVEHGAALSSRAALPKAAAIAPAPKRAQRYEATLRVQVRDVAAAVAAAQRIATSLAGYPVSVHVATGPESGTAQLVLRVPRSHVQAAVTRLSKLGTVVGEQLDIQDLQAGINATDRTIARLQRQLKAATTPEQRAALTRRIVALQRAQAETLRKAHYATVRLSLTSTAAAKHHRHVNFWPWLGGAAAMLLVVLVWRVVRRLREDALLSRS